MEKLPLHLNASARVKNGVEHLCLSQGFMNEQRWEDKGETLEGKNERTWVPGVSGWAYTQTHTHRHAPRDTVSASVDWWLTAKKGLHLVHWLFGTNQTSQFTQMTLGKNLLHFLNEHTLTDTLKPMGAADRALHLWSCSRLLHLKVHFIKLSFLCVFVFRWVKTTHGAESKTSWGKLSWGTRAGWNWLPPHWRCPAHNSTCEEYTTDYTLCCMMLFKL